MSYDDKGHAEHYRSERLDAMTIFERIFGTMSLMTFCEMNALKYRIRLGKKNSSLEVDLTKANWYESQAKILFKKLGTDSEIKVYNRIKYSQSI